MLRREERSGKEPVEIGKGGYSFQLPRIELSKNQLGVGESPPNTAAEIDLTK